MQRRHPARVYLLLITIAACIGCTPNTGGRYAITGTVTLDGSPLEKGNIGFQPLENGRTSSGAVISGGKFTIPADKGLPPGKYRVEIHAAAPGTPPPDPNAIPGSGPPPPKELVPPEWNEASKQTIEVKKEGPFNFAFDIATKGK